MLRGPTQAAAQPLVGEQGDDRVRQCPWIVHGHGDPGHPVLDELQAPAALPRGDRGHGEQTRLGKDQPEAFPERRRGVGVGRARQREDGRGRVGRSQFGVRDLATELDCRGDARADTLGLERRRIVAPADHDPPRVRDPLEHARERGSDGRVALVALVAADLRHRQEDGSGPVAGRFPRHRQKRLVDGQRHHPDAGRIDAGAAREPRSGKARPGQYAAAPDHGPHERAHG